MEIIPPNLTYIYIKLQACFFIIVQSLKKYKFLCLYIDLTKNRFHFVTY